MRTCRRWGPIVKVCLFALTMGRRLLRQPDWGRWGTNKNSTMRRERGRRPSATLMYAGSHRRSAMRRTVPLTSRAPSVEPRTHSCNGDLPCRGGPPAHGEGLALRAAKKASWTVMRLCRHLCPQEAGQLTGDGGNDNVAGALALSQAAKLAAQQRCWRRSMVGPT